MAQGRPREFERRHGLCEEKALCQIEAHLAYSNKIFNGFHALGDGSRATAVSKFEDSVAHHLFQLVIGTTGDEFSVHFKFDEWKILKSDELWPFDSKIIDRDGNVVESKLAGDIFRPFEVADHLGAVDFYR